jgi:type IV pilus assembly protein PilC
VPTYFFSARSNSGQSQSGKREASSETELARALREEGYVLTSVTLADLPTNRKKLLFSFSLLNRVPLVEKMIFSKNLAVMIGAGLSLTRSLEALSEQTKNKSFSKTITKINDDVKKGQSFADALAKHPKIFSDLFVNMVRVGETAGNMEEILKVLAGQMEKDHDLISRVRNAMIYPAVILVVMLGIGIAMMIAVVPKLTAIFSEMNVDLPFTTKIVIALSNFLSNNLIVSLLILAAIPIGVRLALQTTSGKKYLGIVLLKLPVFGNIVKKMNSARLARTLGSLIEGGVPIVKGLQIVSGTLSNYSFRQSLINSATVVQKGQSLSQALKSYNNLYPSMVNQMIQVGEETGTLGDILIKMAGFYEEEVTGITKNLSSIIEPLLMVIIGAAVGFFAISMIQPMYSVMDTI